ncbi:MAG: beta-eliminating lyase-related protein [Holophagaceae bacterium]|nr:beta-eliminating lyase-related protein [Holophagaceae bacterium]
MRPIDLRSDTVTQPSTEMRAAMASAEVGDDVLERDSTLARLEDRVAGLLGLEATLWVPSGCMGNLIALMLHLKRGDRFLAPAQAHVLGSELGTGAWLAGGMPEALAWEGGPGRPTPAQVTKAAGAPGPYYTLRTTLLCLENTHNFAGGAVTPLAEHRALVAAAKAAKLAVHLDGARLWHAAAALDLPPSALAEGVDTVQVCLSKGLGAPMGSLLGGSRAHIAEARRIRKMLGGGVRQGGVVGAAGLVALDYLPRIAEDHTKIRRLAEGLRRFGLPAPVPDTNILLVPVPDVAAALVALETAGVRALPVGPAIRFIAHRDLTTADIEEALCRIEPLVPVLRGA